MIVGEGTREILSGPEVTQRCWWRDFVGNEVTVCTKFKLLISISCWESGDNEDGTRGDIGMGLRLTYDSSQAGGRVQQVGIHMVLRVRPGTVPVAEPAVTLGHHWV